MLINATIGVDWGKTLTKIRVVSKSEPYFSQKVTVMLVGFALELVVELVAGATSCSKEVWKERCQCFQHRVF